MVNLSKQNNYGLFSGTPKEDQSGFTARQDYDNRRDEQVGGTVDARKIISRLRHDGLPIGDEWVILFDENGKIIGRYKRYFYTKDGQKPGFREIFWNQQA